MTLVFAVSRICSPLIFVCADVGRGLTDAP
jgi:hypothetical protein